MDRRKGKRLSPPVASRGDPPPQQNADPTPREAGKTGRGAPDREAPAQKARYEGKPMTTSPSLAGYLPPARGKRLPISATTSFVQRPRGDENLAAPNSAVPATTGTDQPGKPRRLPISISRGALDRLA